MNRKQLVLLLVCGAVIGGLGWWAYRKQQAPYVESTRKMGELVLPKFPLNEIAALTIQQRGAALNLARKDERWVVQERGGYPANFSTLRDLLMKISELKITKPVRVGQSRLGQLELLPPSQCASTLLEFKDAKGKVLSSMLLGAKHTKEAEDNSPYGGGSWPDGRYIMVNNDIQTAALISDPLTSTEPKAEDWLNKDWFKVEKLRSISVTTTNATNNWKLSRDSETNQWVLADPKPGEQLDTSKISGVTSALSSPYFSDVFTNNAPEQLKHASQAKLETLDGFTYDVKFANKSGDDYFVQVAVSGTLPKERVADKDEKPEDKAKLDKEFNEKKTKLEEKLKTEQAYGKWTYVVSKWTIDALLKERKDLLQEKKEETKPAETNAATPPPAATPATSSKEK